MGIPRFGHFCSIDNCIRYFLLHLFCLYFMLFLSFIFLLCWLESKRLPHPSEVSLNLVLLIFNSLTLSSFVFIFFFDHLFLCNKGIKKYFLLLFRHSNFTFLSPYFILLQQTLKCSLSPTLFFFKKSIRICLSLVSMPQVIFFYCDFLARSLKSDSLH